MAASILLCAEDSSSIFGFGDEQEAAAGARASGSPYCGGELAVEFPLPSEECVARWVATEAEHMPREDYAERLRAGGVDLRVRVDAVDWIWKVHTYYGFGPVTACLALNYMDRFLSLYQIPEGKAWMTQLLSVACLSLAAKMDETSVPQSIDLQAVDARYVFEAKTIQRMELLVLSTLKWRMQAVTPFSYLDYFLHQLCGGNAPSRQAVRDATELILCISGGAHARNIFLVATSISVRDASAVSTKSNIVDRFTHDRDELPGVPALGDRRDGGRRRGRGRARRPQAGLLHPRR
uniref:Cyclin-like domain-containing protein n=1 Tax=Triticum aestivum TaxID=4565 RepID=A0A3B6KKF6_WHEAT